MATNTYVALDTVTVSGSSTSTIQFTNIPAGYTDLVVVSNTRSSDSRSGYQSVSYTFNSTGSGQYGGTILYGNGSSAASYRQPNGSVFEGLTIMNGSTSGIFYTNILNIMDYSNTSVFKSVLIEMGAAGLGSYKQVACWRNTAAITTIEIKEPSNLAWVAGSSATLYGVAAAGAPTAKATGGTITYDVSYTYHTFTSSGTFTPLESLNVDYLAIAGGGGGGYSFGGGGGAGGFLTANNYAVTATGYGITVGAGGAGGTSGAGTSGGNSVFGSFVSVGGGGGGSDMGDPDNGANGGSGGGSAIDPSTTATGTAGQGNNGGLGNRNNSRLGGGGGGGAGAVGGNNNGAGTAGAGGNGLATTFTGTSVTYAGGGGAGGSSSYSTVGGAAGTGGAGAGGVGGGAGGNASGNTGSGGGGGQQGNNGGNGGSGIVIIRYAN